MYFQKIVVIAMFVCFSAFAKVNQPIFPLALTPGDTIGIVATAYAVKNDLLLSQAIERWNILGFKVQLSQDIHQKFGYLAGTDQQRAASFNQMVVDPNIKAIIEYSGGWGSDRILSLIDYNAIKNNPKIIMGYSDFTSLLLAIYAKTGLVTFHGPVASSPMPRYTLNFLEGILFKGEKVTFKNPIQINTKTDVINELSTYTLNQGKAEGRLIGGNLTLLTSLIGTEFLPDFHHAILFIEDTGEEVYKIDRMLSQLKNAGLLKQLSGIVFGGCLDCRSRVANVDSRGGFSLVDLLKQYVQPLNIPAFMGANFGHQSEMFILPEGMQVKMDAKLGSISMLHSAVQKR